MSEYRKEWGGKNKERIYLQRKHKMETDPVYKFEFRVRENIRNSFKRACNEQYTKSKRTADILGCSIEEFVSYISNQFKEGMTLANHGEWHLDHHTPLATAETEEDIIRLCHYTNYKPLWANDNLRKGAKIIN